LTDSGHLDAGLLNILVGKLVPLPGSGASESLKVQDWEKALRGIIGVQHEKIQNIALGGVGYNSVDFGECPCLYPPIVASCTSSALATLPNKTYLSSCSSSALGL